MSMNILESSSLVTGDINQLAEEECKRINRFNRTIKFQTSKKPSIVKFGKSDDFDDD